MPSARQADSAAPLAFKTNSHHIKLSLPRTVHQLGQVRHHQGHGSPLCAELKVLLGRNSVDCQTYSLCRPCFWSSDRAHQKLAWLEGKKVIAQIEARDLVQGLRSDPQEGLLQVSEAWHKQTRASLFCTQHAMTRAWISMELSGPISCSLSHRRSALLENEGKNALQPWLTQQLRLSCMGLIDPQHSRQHPHRMHLPQHMLPH